MISARLLGAPIAVVFLAGIAAAATYEDDATAAGDGDEAAETTTTRPEAGADDATTTTLGPVDGTTTTTGGSASVATTQPATATTAAASPGGTTAAPPPTSAPADGPADLIVHLSGSDLVTVTVENAGPGQAPGITVVLSGVEGLQANQLTVGSGVDCFGDGTITCTVAATGVGGRIGEIDVPVPAGQCLTATVTSSVDDPNPGDNSRQRGAC